MSKKLLTAQGPEAVRLAEALGLRADRVHSIEFKLAAGELALLSITTYVEVDTAEQFVELFQQFNLVPVSTSPEEEPAE